MVEDLKNVLKHSFIYTLGNMLSKIVGFFMIPVYTRYLTPADYGVLELVTLVSVVLSMLLSLRLTSALTRYYHEYQDQREKNRLVSTVQISVIVIAGLAVLLLSHTSAFISNLVVGNSSYAKFFIFVFISMAFDICSTMAFTYIRILEKSMFYVAMTLIQLVIGLALNIYLVVWHKMGVLGILYSMVISNGAIAVILLSYTFVKVKLSFDYAKLKQQIVFGLPFVPASLLIFILNMGDRFLLNRFVPLAEVGLYALGYKFGMLLGTFISGPFGQIWAPKRVEIYKFRPNREEIFSRVFVYYAFVLVYSGLILAVLIKEVLTLMATPEYLSAYRIVPFVIIGYVFYALYYVVDLGLFMENKTYWYPIINGIAAAANVALNFLLIPKLGALGAAIVTAISFGICPIMTLIVSQRYYFVPYDLTRAGKIVLLAVLFFCLGTRIDTHHFVLNVLLKSLFICLYPVVLYLINFFDEKEINFVKSYLQRYSRLAFLVK